MLSSPRLFRMNLKTAVNVSAVPHLSPFRYPGGKTWLVPLVRLWLHSQPRKPQEFIEPFAGGGSVSLAVAFESLADHATMAEIDEEVAAVWLTILSRQGKQLADRIVSFNLTPRSADRILSQKPHRRIDKAFQALLKNRINHGGVMATGAGRLKYGDGRGISSRWYPETLRERILKIHNLRNRITFVEGDGLALIRQFSSRTNCVFFFDPPYTAGGKAAGRRLYRHNEIDHSRLFRMANQLKGDFLMTYENSEEVRQLAKKYGFETERIIMNNKLHTKTPELLIGLDLSWLRPTERE